MKSRWKRIPLEAVDPSFSKDGSGAANRMAITGTRSSPQFGLDKDVKGENLRKNSPPRRKGRRDRRDEKCS